MERITYLIPGKLSGRQTSASMLCAAPVFRRGGLERTVRILMIVSGVLSLAGLIGMPLENMQVRMIGVLGYVGVAPVVFLLLSMIFEHADNQD